MLRVFDLAVSRRLLIVFMLITMAVSAAFAQLSFGKADKFNDGWRFTLGGDTIGATSLTFDDSSWRELSLPHDWSIEALPSPTLNACTGFFPGGIGWYRKHFAVTDNAPVHYIYFEGVYNRSEVWLNGHLLGRRPNGYVSFYYDMTPYLVDGDNVLAVRVDHSREADSRWYTGSGIYRDVYIVAAGKARLEPWGLGWKAVSISDKKAVVDVELSAVDENASASPLKAVVSVSDGEGRIVATGSTSVNPGKRENVRLTIKNPERWDLDNPCLYTIDARLLRDGREADRASARLGLRTIGFSPDNGFTLNGRNIKVKGVCIHHDAGVLGAVVPRDVWKRRIVKIKELGANAIRMSHNPQAPVVYDLCDELGMLVMDEASDEWEYPKRKWVTGWNVGTPKFEGSYDFFEEWIDRDVADMVRRDRNHPSVVFWSIGNEVDYPNDPYSHPILDSISINQPTFGGFDPDAPRAERIGDIAHRLSAVVRGIDTSRPVTGALAGVVMSNQTSYPEAVDIVGYNYTEDRYQCDHEAYPGRVIYGSENGHSYDAWLAVRDNDHIFGQFVWTGLEYLGEAGVWPSRGLGTGLLDFAGFMKPRGKFRASLWRDDPVAYVGTYPVGQDDTGLSIDAPGLWNYDEGQPVRVVCYTNTAQARLSLDGNVIGEMKPYDKETGIICWDVAFRPGTLRVEGCDSDGNVVASDTVVTSGRPYALRASADVAELSVGSTAHIVVEVVDDDGNPVTLGDNDITCTVDGPARLLGLENGSNIDMSDHRDSHHRAYNGRLLAYIRPTGSGDDIWVNFTSPLLKSAKVRLSVKRK